MSHIVPHTLQRQCEHNLQNRYRQQQSQVRYMCSHQGFVLFIEQRNKYLESEKLMPGMIRKQYTINQLVSCFFVIGILKSHVFPIPRHITKGTISCRAEAVPSSILGDSSMSFLLMEKVFLSRCKWSWWRKHLLLGTLPWVLTELYFKTELVLVC